jgi:hypothetical protein
MFGPEDDDDLYLEGTEDQANEDGQDFDDADGDDDAGAGGQGEGVLDHANAGDAGEGGEDAEVKQPSRGQSRIQAATRIAAEAKARADVLERQMQELREERQQQSNNYQFEQERQALANMDPLERIEYQTQKIARDTEARFVRLQQDMVDAQDKAAFAARCASNSALAGIAKDVEAALAQSRSGGVTIPRETVAAYILGQRMLEGGKAARTKQVKKAAASVSRERASPVSGGSDVGGSSRGGKGSVRSRLDGVNI